MIMTQSTDNINNNNNNMSDCYVRGTDLLYHYIALLFNSMLVHVHGVVPEDFRVSILVPILKGSRVDTRNFDNYRAVALIVHQVKYWIIL